jgi:twitching motility protein PilT
MRNLFGQLAIQRECLTPEQLQIILAAHGRESQQRPVGEIAVALGFLTRPQLLRLLGEQEQILKARSKPRSRKRSPAPENIFAASPTKGTLVDNLLKAAIRHGASDLHLQSALPPFVRRNGELVQGGARSLESEELTTALLRELSETARRVLKAEGEVDFCRRLENGYRVRGNIYRERLGLAATFRLIPSTIPTIDELNLPSHVATLTTIPQGLVLLAGPAGCGKSTTLAALIALLNAQRSLHVISLEDPIEFIHESDRCTITQRQIGVHTSSYAVGLRSALREDPDVIVIGELRDQETIHLAMTAAETGHLVIGTLHTATAETTVSRLLGVFDGDTESQMRSMLAESIRAVLCQRLVPAVAGGQVPLVELLFNVPAVANCIRDRKLHQLQSIMQTGRANHMMTRQESGRDLLARGLITNETFQRCAE